MREAAGHTAPVEESTPNHFSKDLERFLSYLRNIEEMYTIAAAGETKANAETQDILHSMELEKHTYHELAQLGRKLTTIRQERRVAKNTIYQTAPVYTWIGANKKAICELEQALGAVRKAEQKMGTRTYTPRTDAAKLK